MIWLDAQLPPALARWFKVVRGVNAIAVRDLGLRDASDVIIFNKARLSGYVIITKDIDFVHLSIDYGPPPQIVHLTCGNLTNDALVALFEARWDVVQSFLAAGEPIVELG